MKSLCGSSSLGPDRPDPRSRKVWGAGFVILAIAFAARTAGAAAPDVDGWRGAKFGMSMAEVLRAMDREGVVEFPQIVDLEDGTVMYALLDGLQLGGERARAYFIGRKGGKVPLVKVLIRPVDDSKDDIQLFRAAKCDLESSYGPPTSVVGSEAENTIAAVWSFPSGEAELRYTFQIHLDVRYFSLVYRTKSPAPAAQGPAASGPPHL